MDTNASPPTPAVPPPLPSTAQSPWRLWHFAVAWIGGLFGSIAGLPFTSFSLDSSVDPTLQLTGTDTLAILLPAQLLGNIVVLAVLVKALKLPFERGLGFDLRPRDGWFVLVGVALSVAITLAVTPLANALDATEDPQGMGALMETLSPGLGVFVAFLAIVVVTPMVEEILFRGILQRAFRRWFAKWPAIVLTAIVFALFHVLGVSSENFVADAVVTVVSILAVGLLLSWLVERDHRLGRAIAVHTGFNLVAFIALFVAGPLG